MFSNFLKQSSSSLVSNLSVKNDDTYIVFSISRQTSRCQQAFSKPYLVNLISKDTHLVFSISSYNLRWKVFICLYLGKPPDVNKRSQSLAWQTRYQKTLTSILYLFFQFMMESIHMSIPRQASRCQQAFSKPYLVNLISKDTHQYSISLLTIYDGKCSYVYTSASFAMSTSILKALPGKLDIKRHSPVFSISSYNLRWKVFICLYLGKPHDVNKRSQSLTW